CKFPVRSDTPDRGGRTHVWLNKGHLLGPQGVPRPPKICIRNKNRNPDRTTLKFLSPWMNFSRFLHWKALYIRYSDFASILSKITFLDSLDFSLFDGTNRV